jgi:hypothetical protein
MCDTSRVAVAGPRWGALYAATAPPLTALAIVEVAGPVGVARTALRLALALGAFVGMAVWVHANRPAFDLQNWCDCAGRTMTVRVIESRRPLPSTPPSAVPVLDSHVEEYELAQR